MPENTHKAVQAAGKFVTQLVDAATPPEGSGISFDSATAQEAIVGGISGRNLDIPAPLQIVYDEVQARDGEKGTQALTSRLLKGIFGYKAKHGHFPRPDMAAHAFASVFGATDQARQQFGLPATVNLDSASSNDHGENLSLQSNRAIVSVMAAFSEAIPFAAHLPYDLGSNQAKLAILTHHAGSTYGDYAAGAQLNGIENGKSYLTNDRTHALALQGNGHWTGTVTSVQTSLTACDGSAATGLQRGRTELYVNGIPAGGEATSSGTGLSAITGSVEISGTTYTLTGTVNLTTGAVDILPSAALPGGTQVLAVGYLDLETHPDMIPSLYSAVQTYDLFAAVGRWYCKATPDSVTQMQNELGLNPLSESMIVGNQQYGAERHYKALKFARFAAVNNNSPYDFNWAVFGQQKTRAQIWMDFGSILGAVSQQMAIDTKSFGIRYLYVGRKLAAQFQSLPRDIFEPSGVREIPGIYRIGRLFGIYEVYYCPRTSIVSEGPTTAEILCIGQSPDVARNPIVLGDAVPLTPIPLGTGTDLKQGTGFYIRNFTKVNPFPDSAKGFALITVSNLF
jgi:hypothetical protein